MNIDEFLASAHPYAEATKRTYRDVIPRVLDQCPDPATLSAAGLVKAIDNCNWGNKRRCVALAAVKKYLAWTYGNSHPALQAKIKRVQSKKQRSLTAKQVRELLASFNTATASGSRNLAIASLAIDTGLRVSELCRLQKADTDLEHLNLQVITKGGQWGYAIFSQDTADYIRHYLKFRIIADGQGYLFTNTYTGEGLTPEGLNIIVRKWGASIHAADGALGVKLCPHDLRRTFAELATLGGAPLNLLMLGGRWNNEQMPRHYTRNLQVEAFRQYLPMSALKK